MKKFNIASCLSLLPHEQVYRKLYEGNPSIYHYDERGRLYGSWKEFADYYQMTKARKVEVVRTAPTLFGDEITEKDFFKTGDADVDLVFNARFCPPFWHNLKFIKVMYVLHGSIDINISLSRKIVLRQGHFIIVPPNVMQSVFSWHDEDVVVNIFLKLSTFEKAFASMLMEDKEISGYFWKILYGKDRSILRYDGEENVFLRDTVLRLLGEHEKARKGGNFLMVSYVMTFVAYALTELNQCLAAVGDESREQTQFSEIMQYIRIHYNTITLPSLAAQFGRNESYMSRYIKAETGYSLVQLLMKYRMRQAAAMLRETECSVEQIMYEVGYTDISYFYKLFARHYGMTPKKYRELEDVVTLR